MVKPGKRGMSMAQAMEKVAPKPSGPVDEAAAAAVEAQPEEAERERLILLTVQVCQSDHQRIKDLSYHSKISIQQLGIEAWNLLLEGKGHPALKPTKQNKPSGTRRG